MTAHACDCGAAHPGIHYPTEANGDASRDWLEACDLCRVFRGEGGPVRSDGEPLPQFAGDLAAAQHLAGRLGRRVGMARPAGSSTYTPYLTDKETT